MNYEMDENGPENTVATLPKPAHKRAILTPVNEPTPFDPSRGIKINLDPQQQARLEEVRRNAEAGGFKLHQPQAPEGVIVAEGMPVEPIPTEPNTPAEAPKDQDPLQLLINSGVVRPDVTELSPEQSPFTPAGEEFKEVIYGKPTGGIKPATPEQVAEFEEGIKTGRFRGMEVVEETGSGNARALELRDPKTGKTILWRLQQTEGAVELGGFLDNSPNLSLDKLTNYVMGQIEKYENPGNYDKISEGVVAAMITTLDNYYSETITDQEREALSGKALFRLRLALLEKQAVYGDADGFASGANQWGREGLQYITVSLDKDPTVIDPTTGKEKYPSGENLRVRKALGEYEEAEGEYFRFRTKKQQDDRKKEMADHMEADYWGINFKAEKAAYEATGMTAVDAEKQVKDDVNSAIYADFATKKASYITAGMSNDDAEKKAKEETDLFRTKAELSVKLAEKAMKATGQATIYGGPVYPPGHPKAGKLIEMDIIDRIFVSKGRPIDLTDESYWEELAKAREEVGIQIVPTTIRGHVVTLPTGEQTFALGHTTQAIFKNTFYTPEVLKEKPDPDQASELFKATETRVRCLAWFENKIKLTEVVDIIDDDQTGIKGSINFLGATDLGTWAGMVKGGNDLKKKLTEGDKPFLLYNPLTNPNAARQDPGKATEAMNPFLEVARSYGYLANYRKLAARVPGGPLEPAGFDIEGPARAKLDLAASLLGYLDTEEAQTKFGYRKWNSNIKQTALVGLKKHGVLTLDQVKDIMSDQHISAVNAMFQAFFPEATEGMPSLIFKLTRLITQS